MIASMSDESLITAIRAIGLTDLEARVYLHLLSHGPETGYSIGKAIGKPNPNVYMAIESLHAKGVLEVAAGEPRLCRATPVDEVLAAARSRFDHALDAAARALAGSTAGGVDDGVYQLGSAAQVIQRARRLLADARSCAVVDALPAIADELAEDMAMAATRGVSVVALVYRPITIPGVETILHSMGELAQQLIEGEHILLSRDASEVVLGLLDPPSQPGAWSESGGVRQAIYTASTFLAWHLHDNFHHQLFTYAIAEGLAQDDPMRGKLMRIYESRLLGIAPLRSPGWRTMLERFGSEDAQRLTDEHIAKSDRARSERRTVDFDGSTHPHTDSGETD
ncbi:MAG: hypothetical protein EA380_06540 [Phycisphaeraceae bacterium]|nr:MAG: hypothetical protein EA380_06540 [Phycisphaeraceae bacterium]